MRRYRLIEYIPPTPPFWLRLRLAAGWACVGFSVTFLTLVVLAMLWRMPL